ncbi:hypothetical protein FQA39_LY13901 [Lamprigera yunnana]|nr:hypothetical protein FQA39_LY13901 [Lamprigera yunnana]
MCKLVLTVLLFNFASSSLIVPYQECNIKQCIYDVIKNVVDLNTTVLYVYDDGSDDIFPGAISNPFVKININKSIATSTTYKIYNEILILNLKKLSIHHCLWYLKGKGLWSLKTTIRRKYFVTYPLKKISKLMEVFSYFYKYDIIDVIVMAYDFTKKNDTIKLFTWDPYRPSNNCGTHFNFIQNYTCKTIKTISNSKRWRSYNRCNLTHYVEEAWEWDETQTEVASVSQFLLHMICNTLNVTLILKQERHPFMNVTGLLTRLIGLEKCQGSYVSCDRPFLSNEYVWIVPPPKRIGSLDVFRITFKTIVWFFILATFLFTFLVWWLIGRYNNPSLFTSNLVKLLTIPQFERALATAEELAQSDLSIIINEKQSLLFRSEDLRENSVYSRIKKRLNVSSYDDHMKAAYEREVENYTIFMTLDIFYRLINRHKTKVQVFLDGSVVGAMQRTLGTKPGSFLMPSVHNVVTGMIEAGFIGYHKNIFYQKYMKKHVSFFDNKVNVTEDVVALNFVHVYPVFVFWGFGLVLALGVFIWENIIYIIKQRAEKKRNRVTTISS